MTTKEEFKKRITHALEGPYIYGLITKNLMDKIQVYKDNKTDVRNFYSALKDLRNTRKGGTLIFERIGREKVNFFPENKELVVKKWGLKEKSEKTEISLESRKDHTRDMQVNVIKPLSDRFKKIYYGWEFSPLDEKERTCWAERGAFYGEVCWGGERGMHMPLNKTVKSSVLLDDYLKNHAPVLATMMEEFDEQFNEFWKNYFEIHEEIRKIINRRIGLPITMYDYLSESKNFQINEESATTNLQYTLADYVIYKNVSISSNLHFQFSVKENNEMFECWSKYENPEKCYLKEKCRGRSVREFHDEINNKISMILEDIKNCDRLQEMSNKYWKLRDNLFKQQYEILTNLEKDMHKVLDGICDLCGYKAEAEKEKKEQDFDENILHQYFHEKI